MKNYEIFKINEYESYLLLLSNEDIYYLYDEIRTKTNGEKILVDMFFRNGFSFNRFIELIFDDDNQVTTRVKIIESTLKNQLYQKVLKRLYIQIDKKV